jgi:hypothetical protein
MVLGPLSTLYPESGKRSPIVVIAGHGGRAKTAQLYQMFAGYAAKVTRDGPLPLFARLNDFEPSDVSAAEGVARAVAKACCDASGATLAIDPLADRLSQPFVLFVDGDQDVDNRKCQCAFEWFEELAQTPARRLIRDHPGPTFARSDSRPDQRRGNRAGSAGAATDAVNGGTVSEPVERRHGQGLAASDRSLESFRPGDCAVAAQKPRQATKQIESVEIRSDCADFQFEFRDDQLATRTTLI